MSEKSFEYIVGGIEDGIIAALNQAIGVDNGNDGYVRTIATYSGELDSDQIKQAISALTARFPLLLVSYGDGEDKLDPPTPAVKNKPRHYRHDCTFSVICCSNNARSDQARRRGKGASVGVYRMISDVRFSLGGLRFRVQDGDETYLLNPEPLTYAGVEYFARLPEVTAYGVHFNTYFRFSEPDRTQQGPLVSELVFDVNNTFKKGEINLPGVVYK